MLLALKKIISLLTAYLFFFQVLSLPAMGASPHCPGSRQEPVPAYPLAQKDANQQKCDALAEAPGEPNNSGQGVAIDQINTSEAHAVCYQAANGQAWRARYQFIFGRVLEAENNWADAAKWYEAAGDNGFTDAYVSLGALYSRSQPANYDQAAAWFQKAVAHNSPTGALMLGWLYQTGQGVQRNPGEAARLYVEAGNAGIADAAYRVGLMCEDGDGVQKDPFVAAKWFYEAAKRGHAYAQEELGYLFYSGSGVKKDARAAYSWFYPAAQAGLSRSQTAVAIELDRGEIVQKDEVQAVAWYAKAAEQGEVYAMYQLGGHYRQGSGVAWSETEAAKWFRKAADQGSALAQSALGYGYMYGLGKDVGQGTQDYSQAIYWLTKAAQQGEPYAEVNLGWMYENGWGVERNLEQAHQLYLAASRSDNPNVASFAKKFADGMSAYSSSGSGQESAQSSSKTPGWVAPVLVTVGVLALFSALSGGHGSGSGSSGSSSGGSYPSQSFPDTGSGWGGSSTPEVHVPNCRQVPVENAFGTQNGDCLASGSNCGYSGATTIQCD